LSDKLSGDAAMTTEQIDKLHQARPFRSFTIHLADGTAHRVLSPEFLSRSQGGRTLYLSTGGEDIAIIDMLLVTKLTTGNGARRMRRRREE
jgi:hypothetical protein